MPRGGDQVQFAASNAFINNLAFHFSPDPISGRSFWFEADLQREPVWTKSVQLFSELF
jgi:hypothetical protein